MKGRVASIAPRNLTGVPPTCFSTATSRSGTQHFARPKNLDLSVAKEFGPQRVRTLIRADFLNVFNHPIYGGPYNIGNTLDYGDVGQVFGTRNDPRFIQVAAKVMF